MLVVNMFCKTFAKTAVNVDGCSNCSLSCRLSHAHTMDVVNNLKKYNIVNVATGHPEKHKIIKICRKLIIVTEGV